MVDTSEKILLRVEFDQSEAIKKVAALQVDINALTAANKELAKSTGTATKEYQENARLIKNLSDEQRALNRNIDASIAAFSAEEGSIQQLKKNLSLATEEYNKMSRAQRNSAQGKELQASIRATTDELKELEGAIGDNRRNVGNYGDALKELTGHIQVNGFNLNSVSEGFKIVKDATGAAGIQMQSFNGILKLSIIGVIITLVAGLAAAFMRFKPVADKVEQVFSGINAAVGAVVESLINVGNGLIKIIQGNFSEGIAEIRGAFDGLGDSIKTAYNAGVEFAKLQQDIDDINRQTLITNSKLNKEIDQLLLKSRNRTLSEKQRLALLDQASKKESQALANSLNLANKELELAQKRFDEAERTKQMTDEIEDARVNAIVKINELESQSLNLQEKITNRRDQLVKEFEDNRIKAEEELNKARIESEQQALEVDKIIAEEKLKLIRQQAEEAKAATEKKIQYLLNESISTAEINKIIATSDEERYLAERQLIEANYQVKLDALSKINAADSEYKRLEVERLQMLAVLDRMRTEQALEQISIMTGALNQLNQNSFQNAEFGKSLAIAQSTINTYEGATKAFAQGGVLGFLTGSAIIAAGLANVQRIANTDIPSMGGAAAGGGSFMTKGPTMLLVGDNPGGVERIDVTPISGKGQTTINPNGNLVAMAGGGSLVTGFGGFAERKSTIDDPTDYDKLAKSLEKINIYTKITEIEKVAKKRSNIASVSEL